MVILGLGSNSPNTLQHLRSAVSDIRKLSGVRVKYISPIYRSDALLPDNAPAHWNMDYLNIALLCDVSMSPRELLSRLKTIEINMGRELQAPRWSPRIIDIDMLAWDDLVLEETDLQLPHAGLLDRPFALWPLADVAPFWRHPVVNKTAAQLVEPWGSRFDGHALLHTKQISQRIESPHLVGIMNVTPDSFSDAGLCIHPEAALQQAIALVNAGADILDIGAESTAPNAPFVDAATEWQRLEPVLHAILQSSHAFHIKPLISVDTRHPDVAAKALALGVDWINDVSGLDNPAMRHIMLSAKTADCVVMHHLTIPASRESVIPRDQDPVAFVYEWAAKRLDELEKFGLSRERIIFDPGIGFGKTAEQSLLLLKHCEIFRQLGVRLLIGHSRKSFFSVFTQQAAANRDIETVASSLFLMNKPVDYLRVHNVEACARGIKVIRAMAALFEEPFFDVHDTHHLSDEKRLMYSIR
jgi:2-amino-4-hydroxy-6-hydroxymethyldihydropteridine diphosphokinase/dihydropteroate synthase